MNSVLYHLHPVKVKRHAVKVSYTLCLGGLCFFLFILLTVTGIFLMFFYRPTAAQAWDDIYTLQTSVTFGLLVRNMHRWGAHLMVLSVFLHMARVFYHGAYKPPREFNWVIGVVLLLLTLLLSFTGYLLPWDQLALTTRAVRLQRNHDIRRKWKDNRRKSCTMSTLLKNLGFDLSYPLHDATGLAGEYKIDLSWIPTESPPGTLFVEMEKTAWSRRMKVQGRIV